MGILNVTPDSFSDGGAFGSAGAAVRAGLAMAAAGADIVDVGGESTRPGAAPVRPDEEQARVLPVIAGLAAAGVCVSADTRHASTMAAALAAGAAIINDVSGFTHEPGSARVAAEAGCAVVLMHMRGTPQTMDAQATYGDVVEEVAAELLARVHAAIAAGVDRSRIALDPGLGFAKRGEHNVKLLKGLSQFRKLGYPLVVGASRKRFVGELSGVAEPAGRLAGSLAAGLFALASGASVLRVHDAAETAQAVRVWRALAEG
jgi:dihydropteroate synthase